MIRYPHCFFFILTSLNFSALCRPPGNRSASPIFMSSACLNVVDITCPGSAVSWFGKEKGGPGAGGGGWSATSTAGWDGQASNMSKLSLSAMVAAVPNLLEVVSLRALHKQSNVPNLWLSNSGYTGSGSIRSSLGALRLRWGRPRNVLLGRGVVSAIRTCTRHQPYLKGPGGRTVEERSTSNRIPPRSSH